MATYKNGHKKKNSEKFISYILIGFAATFFAILLTILLFNVLDDTVEITVSNFTEMEEDEYLVYFYSDNCSACIAIKDEVAAFRSDNAADIKLYYFDSATITQSDFNYLSGTYGVTGTPAMFTVVNGVVVDVVAGSLGITDSFDSINAGTYTLIN